jgi:hypothetical protein
MTEDAGTPRAPERKVSGKATIVHLTQIVCFLPSDNRATNDERHLVLLGLHIQSLHGLLPRMKHAPTHMNGPHNNSPFAAAPNLGQCCGCYQHKLQNVSNKKMNIGRTKIVAGILAAFSYLCRVYISPVAREDHGSSRMASIILGPAYSRPAREITLTKYGIEEDRPEDISDDGPDRIESRSRSRPSTR